MPNHKRKRNSCNREKTMDVDAWRERQIHKRLRVYLDQREQDFILDHAGDTDAELTAYVRAQAQKLGRMPHPLEIPGGTFLQERLGDWPALARRLGFVPPGQYRGRIFYSGLKRQITEQFIRERRTLKAQKQ